MTQARKRIEYLSQHHGQYLIARYFSSPDKGSVLKKKLIKKLSRFDPTTSCRYTQWIVIRFLKSEFEIHEYEKLEEIKTLLSLFHSHRHHINPSDINAYNLERLKQKVSSFADAPPVSKRQIKLEIKRQLKQSGQVDDLWNGDLGFKIKHLKTPQAAQFYGQGAKWCISCEQNSKFDEYHQSGDLLCIIGNGRKLLFSMGTGELVNEQNDIFFNPAENQICHEHILGDEPWHLVESLLVWYLALSGYPIHCGPDRFRHTDPTIKIISGYLNDYAIPTDADRTMIESDPVRGYSVTSALSLLEYISKQPNKPSEKIACRLRRPLDEIEGVIRTNPSAICFLDSPEDQQFMELAIWKPEILCFRKPSERGFLDYIVGLHPNLAKQIPYADTALLRIAETAARDWIRNRAKMTAKYKSPIDFIANYCDVSPQARRA